MPDETILKTQVIDKTATSGTGFADGRQSCVCRLARAVQISAGLPRVPERALLNSPIIETQRQMSLLSTGKPGAIHGH
jgi:hypothetical protein